MPPTVATASARTGIGDCGLGIGSGMVGETADGESEFWTRPQSPLRRRPDDARPRESIVLAAMIAADNRGDEAETRRDGEQHPQRSAQERATEIERARRFRRY